MMLGLAVLLLCSLAGQLEAQQISNGQIFTPGIVIVDSPQPNTPSGGDNLHLALDISSNGQLQLPPYPKDPVSAIYNITVFLSSYVSGKNFTVSNGTASLGTVSEILALESGSTVKHINWMWPDCLVGSGSSSDDSSRGLYNISIRQNFRLNGTDAYTIFDLPIQITNSISASPERPSCDQLNNPLITQEALFASANNFTRIAGTAIQSNGKGDGLGGVKPDGTAQDGLGAGVSVNWSHGSHWIWIGAFALMLAI